MKKIISQKTRIETRKAGEPVLALPSAQQVLYTWIKGTQLSARQAKKINEEVNLTRDASILLKKHAKGKKLTKSEKKNCRNKLDRYM